MPLAPILIHPEFLLLLENMACDYLSLDTFSRHLALEMPVKGIGSVAAFAAARVRKKVRILPDEVHAKASGEG
jgi:hypothetical protein